jgi:two-component sensor histidine kinase
MPSANSRRIKVRDIIEKENPSIDELTRLFTKNDAPIGNLPEPMPEGKRLLLRWQEKDGPAVRAASRKGFGSQVLERGLGHELEGEVHLDYQPNGMVCTINIPAPRGAYGG